MMENCHFSPNAVEWKRINMRNVAHLMGVEFIHDLYNRHEPKINSIRFRHTVTIWKDGIVQSYAPTHEWDRLGNILGNQYYALDPSLITYTKALYARKREHFHAFIKRLRATNLTKLSNQDLASLLIRFQSVVLGELYVLNFVQVEHGLTIAVKKILREQEPNPEKAEALFMEFIQSQQPSASQKERLAFSKIVRKHRYFKALSLYREERAKKEIERHHETHKYLYSAYGENPPVFEDTWSVFQTAILHTFEPPKQSFFPRLLTPTSRTLLRALRNKKLTALIPLLVQGGLFRDTNKALLGQSMRYRFQMLDEIARRGLEHRDHLNFYLLAEIVDLLLTSKTIPQTEINRRSASGVMFTRFEDFAIYSQDFISPTPPPAPSMLRGQCASPGVVSGPCKIVLNKKDGANVMTGDIMVAVGTDFDLIDAMHRAAAVVTEEGGILSHAAVVCREMQKPCCIGLKNATHLLRDGVAVRVNATQGEVVLIAKETV